MRMWLVSVGDFSCGDGVVLYSTGCHPLSSVTGGVCPQSTWYNDTPSTHWTCSRIHGGPKTPTQHHGPSVDRLLAPPEVLWKCLPSPRVLVSRWPADVTKRHSAACLPQMDEWMSQGGRCVHADVNILSPFSINPVVVFSELDPDLISWITYYLLPYDLSSKYCNYLNKNDFTLVWLLVEEVRV